LIDDLDDPDIEDMLDDDCATIECPNCHGSGREIEGWPCDYCDGAGELEI